VIDKPSALLSEDTEFIVTGGLRSFVSRGGEKLEAAVEYFHIDLMGKTCLDVGASTGGFTDCMLRHGAAGVIAVENGTGQMAAVLRDDRRVALYERTDIRSFTPDMLPRAVTFAGVDVSFISLTLVLKPVAALLAESAALVCLVKPQYETGPGHKSKRGVVRNPALREKTVAFIAEHARGLGFTVYGILPSPVESANREYLIYLGRNTGHVY
jgi:23S rRNA (cytidine1920-2'-O)/16S rRNA (cytidine1409-2'-O)-methyltransferase